jgi:hypothetical protein
MEMRLLESEAERAAFERGLTQARATKGSSGFGEKRRSRLGRVHMAFADLYGVFDETSDHPDRMLAGFATHSLDLFSQSYPKPDLTHLPPEEVFEVGELWALSLGAGVAARHGCAITLGLAGASTLLIYPIVSPWDLTAGYPDYRAVDAPIAWPFAETLDGRKVFVQAMVLDGQNLQRQISAAMAAPYEASNSNRMLRFGDPLAAALLERRRNRLERMARNRQGPVVSAQNSGMIATSPL